MKPKPKKLYCYVDETGQDAGSKHFIVVVVVAWNDMESLRLGLIDIENQLTIGSKKWHKLRHSSRLEFLNAFLRNSYDNLHIYFGRFKKPVPYFFPTFEVIQKSLAHFSGTIEARVSIDGLDTISAKKMTNALRTKHLRLKLVKGPKDENEVLIRLADRWAGCLRLAILEHNNDCKEFLSKAQKKGLLNEV